ncbi:MAG: glycosyltransferase family 39 protein [bacterium]|nr:glycosyltransferase family 39 protein [bacterium]
MIPRLILAGGTYLNPDEGHHVILGSARNLEYLAQSAVLEVHPPLLIALIYLIKHITGAEVALRLGPLVGAAMAPWFIYRWLSLIWDRRAALLGCIMLALAPNLIPLGAQVRGYALAIGLLAASLYLLEKALQSSSAIWMALSLVPLYLGILTEYSAAWFCGAAGVYGLVRLRRRLVKTVAGAVWLAGQAGATGIYALLWKVQISSFREAAGDNVGTVAWWLTDYYPQPGENAARFAAEGTFGQFSYLFSSTGAGVVALLLFGTGLWALIRAARWEVLVLLIIPFVLACAGAFAGLFPYGASRHTVVLSIFSVSAAAIGAATLLPRRIVFAVPLLLVLTGAWHWAAVWDPSNIPPERKQRTVLSAALDHLHATVPPGSVILTEYEVRAMLGHYLGVRWPIESTGEAEKMGDYWLFALRFSFQNTGDVRTDAAALRAEQNIPPDDPIWVLDGGFYAAVLHEFLRDERRKSEVNHLRFFGDGIALFQIPPDY